MPCLKSQSCRLIDACGYVRAEYRFKISAINPFHFPASTCRSNEQMDPPGHTNHSICASPENWNHVQVASLQWIGSCTSLHSLHDKIIHWIQNSAAQYAVMVLRRRLLRQWEVAQDVWMSPQLKLLQNIYVQNATCARLTSWPLMALTSHNLCTTSKVKEDADSDPVNIFLTLPPVLDVVVQLLHHLCCLSAQARTTTDHCLRAVQYQCLGRCEGCQKVINTLQQQANSCL